MTELWNADTVLMPVPMHAVHEVAGLLADLKSGKAVRAERPAREPAVAVPGQGDWTQTMVDSLADDLSYPGVSALFARCAGSPGEWVVKSVVEDAEGISPVQLRNELSALSKLTRRLFGKVTWPLQYKKDQGKYYYRMDTQVAEWWLEAVEAQR